MTVAVANVTNSNTFAHWLARTNEMAYALSTVAVTVNSNTAVGNAAISGTFAANTFAAAYVTSNSGTISVYSANMIVESNSVLSVLGHANIASSVAFSNAGSMRIPGANATNFVLAANASSGNLFFYELPAATGGTVTSVTAGDGLSGGTITSNGTISVLANTNLVANTSGLHALPTGTSNWNVVTANATLVANIAYLVNASDGTKDMTVPVPVTEEQFFVVHAYLGSVRIISNGNVIQGVGSGNDLMLANGETAFLVSQSNGNLEIV